MSPSQYARITHAALQQDQISVALLGVNGRIQYANQAFARLLHYNQKDLKGKVFERLIRTSAGTRNPGILTDTLAGKDRMPRVVNYLVRKSGESVACLVESHIICDDQGKISHFLVFVDDARLRASSEERNRFEHDLYRAQSRQTLGALAGGVAHDFNNALEVIMGFASLARTRLSTADPLHEPLKIIEDSAKGAAGLIRQLLDVSKERADEQTILDVADLIETVIAIITRTFDRKIQIDHRIDAKLPCIMAVRDRLAQAILNLCINARDAMPAGGKLILSAETRTLDSDNPRLSASHEPGPYVRIAVHDSGTGMPAEILENIFVPQFTTKPPGRGFGLGLPMVDRIVKEARGFISVTSKPGVGSEFALYLPAAVGGKPRKSRRGSARLLAGRGKILVVDDEPRVLEFLTKGLTRLGYEVISAESGIQACEIYSRRRKDIDCILLDLIMPGMSGLEAYARLRNINPGVRVILSSGYSSGRIRREAMESGSPEFLEKPYTLEELSQALQKIQQN